MRGPVRQAAITVVKQTGGVPYTRDTMRTETYAFNTRGKVITRHERKKLPDSAWEEEPVYTVSTTSVSYEFNRRGQLTLATRRFDDDTDVSKFRYGRHKARVIHNYGQKENLSVLTYDRGRIVSAISYRHDGSVESETAYRYLPSGYESEERYFDKGGRPFRKRVHSGDTVDGIVFYYTGDSGANHRRTATISTLNAIGKVASRVELNDTLGIAVRELWQYDEKGNEIDYRQYDYAWPSHKHTTCAYSYDANGITLRVCNDTLEPGRPQQQVKQTIYLDYDGHGNYHRKISTSFHEPSLADTTLEYRSFSYFE